MPDKKDELVVPASEPLPIVEGKPVRQRSEAKFLHVFLYLVTSVIFAFFLVLGGRWVYHKVHHNNQNQIANNSNQNSSSTGTSSSSNSGQGSSNGSTSKSGSASNPASTPSTSSSSSAAAPSTGSNSQNQPQNSSNIPNTGPGNVLAIFLGSSLLVGGLHYVLNQRRTRAEP